MSLADPHVYLADMTGDGLTDVVLASGGGVTYWPARADGGWGTATELSPAPAFSRNHDPNRLFLVDVDGDGCADLVYVDALSVTLWRTTGATQLADPLTVPPPRRRRRAPSGSSTSSAPARQASCSSCPSCTRAPAGRLSWT